MADLVRTIDDDGEAEADGDDGPAFAAKGAFDFGDIVSEDEFGEKDIGGWNFEAEPAEDNRPQVDDLDMPKSLEGRIQQLLKQKRRGRAASGDEQEEDDITGDEGEKAPVKKTKKKKKRKEMEEPLPEEQDADNQQAGGSSGSRTEACDSKASATTTGTAEHLRTKVHFADLRLSRPLLRAVADLGFDTPTPVQRDVIPAALTGKDILAAAETGSGKTASFLLPILERLCQSSTVRSRKRDASGRVMTGAVATKAMILIPTRELAVQCHSMLKDLSRHALVTCELVTGGYASKDQASSLRAQPDIVVATPGRLLDHLLNSHSVHMELLEIVVFDEADRLLEMGFREECLEVLKRCSRGRQTMLFSATMTTSVEDLAALALVKPIRVTASPSGRVAQTLEQEFVRAPSEMYREAVLLSLCTRNYKSGVIIFCATRKACHRLAMVFGLCGLKFAEIHGNLQQAERNQALQRFQQKEVDYLLATDLAARGLDLCNVETVINFHLPMDTSRYIHRVGRTARMGRAGRAVTIHTAEEYAKVKKLGRQCCTKVKAKVMKRVVAADAIQGWQEKIEGLGEDIKNLNIEEATDREAKAADMEVERFENLSKHKADIKARPKKEWIMSNNMKQKLKEEGQAERAKTAAAEAEGVEEEEVKNPGKSAKTKKEKRKEETPEERQRRLKSERMLVKKKEATAEKLEEEQRARIMAKRSRKNAGGGANIAPLQKNQALKNKDRKKNR